MRGVVCFLFVCIGGSLFGQSPQRNVRDLAFLTGRWVTTSPWCDMEEHWTRPMGDNMMCAYRCVKDGRVVYYQLIIVEQTEKEGPVMYLRHFSRGGIGWEEKDAPWEYPLMFLEPNHARFERKDRKTALTFRRTNPDTLRVILERQDEAGRWVEDVFDYTLSN